MAASNVAIRAALKTLDKYVKKDLVDYLQSHLDRYLKTQTIARKFRTKKFKEALAKYFMAHITSKHKLPHTAAETYLKEAMIGLCMICDSDLRAVRGMPVSNESIASAIHSLADYVEKDLITELKESPFSVSIQFDESTDVSGRCMLVLHIRYMHKNGETYEMVEDIWLSDDEMTSTTASDIFNTVNARVVETVGWNKISSVCTDSATALRKGDNCFLKKIQQINGSIEDLHCALHCLNLASRVSIEELQGVLRFVAGVAIKL